MRKELFEEYFKDKKVTVMGLGLLGRGIGDTEFLASHASEVLVTDKKSDVELATSKEALSGFSNITYHLGEHSLSDFENVDCIFKAAGVPLQSEYIKHANDSHIPVYMSAAFVSYIVMQKLQDVKIVGVTGTRGKSTTTMLIAHLLKEGGKRVHLGGNVRGVANLPLLEVIEDGDVLVLELDSWQLQGFRDLKISPHVAVFTSFLDDHLNYYGGNRDTYFEDKAAIFTHQKVGDICFAGPQSFEEISKRGYGDMAVVPDILVSASSLIGEHNAVSSSLAHAVASHLDIDGGDIERGLQTFSPAEGRLEYKGVYRGVHVYNDNNATTPDATIAGIHAIEAKYHKKPLLICGGADKMLDLTKLESVIQNHVKEVVYLAGTGTAKLSVEKKYRYETLEECVREIWKLAEEGDVILYSPGFASFSPHFRNEYEKNDEFVRVLSMMK